MAEPKTLPPLKRSQFVCPKCDGEDGKGALFFFSETEGLQEDGDGNPQAPCPNGCGLCDEVWYIRNLRLARLNQTGARTEAGRRKVAMNRYTTGSSYATGAIPKVLPAAKPGKYPHCDTCQDIDDCKDEVQRAYGTCRPVYCHRQSEIFSKYRQAHQSGDPENLRIVAAENQAKMQMVADACFKKIFDSGVMLERGVYSDGKKVGTEEIINPAINESLKILEKMGFSLTDWTLTPKSKEAKAALEGYLAGRAAEKGVSPDDFLADFKKQLKDFHTALERGNFAVQHDETLQQSIAEEQEGKAGA